MDEPTRTFRPVSPAAPRAPARLRVVTGDAASSFELSEPVVVIGRDESADVRLQAPGVSRHHAKIVTDPLGAAQILDLGAKNGTFVNGQRTKAATLEHGDQIQIGRVVLRFERVTKSSDSADRSRPAVVSDLSSRELEVARLVARGLTNAEIGHVLGISRATVATHLHRAYERLGLAARAELASYVTSLDDT